jgi:hypothetical protein
MSHPVMLKPEFNKSNKNNPVFCAVSELSFICHRRRDDSYMFLLTILGDLLGYIWEINLIRRLLQVYIKGMFYEKEPSKL